jgi:hypothetical protein
MDKKLSKDSPGRSNKAAQRKAKFLENARAGEAVAITVRHVGKKYCTFQFKSFGETFRISSPLGLSLGLDRSKTVNVEYHMSASQHPSAYATKATWEDDVRRLGIRLRGRFSHGPRKGEQFKRWIHCSSSEGIIRARKVLQILGNTGKNDKKRLEESRRQVETCFILTN